MAEGISIREFARRAGCDDKVVRRKLESGHLHRNSDGSLNPAYLDIDWRSGASLPADTVGAFADSADTKPQVRTPKTTSPSITARPRAGFSMPERNHQMIAFSLKTPITVGTETYTELKFRPLRFGDAEALFGAKNELQAMRILLSRIADVPNEVIENLDLQDVADLLGELALAITVPVPVPAT